MSVARVRPTTCHRPSAASRAILYSTSSAGPAALQVTVTDWSSVPRSARTPTTAGTEPDAASAGASAGAFRSISTVGWSGGVAGSGSGSVAGRRGPGTAVRAGAAGGPGRGLGGATAASRAAMKAAQVGNR
jgi:hypothetical protein